MMHAFQMEVDQLLAQKKYQKVLKKIKARQKKNSGVSEYVRLEGIVHLHKKQLVLAEKCFKKALKLDQINVNAMANLAFVYYVNKKLNESAEILKRAILISPNHLEANSQLAHVAKSLKNWVLSESQYRKTLSINPSHMESLVNLAMLLKNNGDIEQSIIYFRQALNINPFQPEIYWTLANLKTYEFSTEEKNIVEQMIEQVTAPKELSALLFTQARYLEDSEQFNDSFDVLKQANHIKYQSFNIEPRNWSELLNDIKAVFTHAFIKKNKCASDSGIYPVLISGMPRSGSTLIEQILASHSQITGASELEYLGEWVKQVENEGKKSYPNVMQTAPISIFQNLLLEYTNKTKVWWQQTPCFTDKMPNNIRHVGAFLMAFPNAKVIHTKRNPVDVCLSAFKQNFEKGSQYSFDLEELVSYYKFQDDLGMYWQKLFPENIIVVEYESVIDDLESETRRLLTFLGFDFEPSCLEFYKTQRSIRTASAGQVTQKIYKSAKQHYLKYGKSLDELITLLAAEDE